MLSVEEARARIIGPLRSTPPEIVSLPDAWGRVLAAPATARLTQPPFDVSAMDGFAVRAGDASAGARLRLMGAAPAGHPFPGHVGASEAIRIYTGSVVPHGADAIVLQEDADATDWTVQIREAAQAGRHIRRAGQDFATGELLIAARTRLGARDIGLAAAANLPWLQVHRRPVIAILATGDEIAMPGDPIPLGGIVSSNSHALAALVRAAGGTPLLLPVAPDDAGAIATAADAARRADLLVTTGGASVGDHDLVQQGLGKRGFTLDFWKIAMRPGKPLIHGRLGDTPVLGLPGNPVSAIVCAVLFLWPAIERLSGLPGGTIATERAVLGASVRANDHRADHLRATLARAGDGILVATPFPVQDSAMLRRLASAQALVLRPAHAPASAAGDPCEVIRLDVAGL